MLPEKKISAPKSYYSTVLYGTNHNKVTFRKNWRAPKYHASYVVGSYYYVRYQSYVFILVTKSTITHWVLWAYRPSYHPTDLQTYYIDLLGITGRLVLCSCVKKYQ
jgi:hypothetical protein